MSSVRYSTQEHPGPGRPLLLKKGHKKEVKCYLMKRSIPTPQRGQQGEPGGSPSTFTGTSKGFPNTPTLSGGLSMEPGPSHSHPRLRSQPHRKQHHCLDWRSLGQHLIPDLPRGRRLQAEGPCADDEEVRCLSDVSSCQPRRLGPSGAPVPRVTALLQRGQQLSHFLSGSRPGEKE